MEEWKVDLLLQQYGLSFKGTLHDKKRPVIKAPPPIRPCPASLTLSLSQNTPHTTAISLRVSHLCASLSATLRSPPRLRASRRLICLVCAPPASARLRFLRAPRLRPYRPGRLGSAVDCLLCLHLLCREPVTLVLLLQCRGSVNLTTMHPTQEYECADMTYEYAYWRKRKENL
ncbi:uncharacterized protein LOC110263715 [Arachis ipaensis]|uniref:uncharacterized protein LOC110263715 n=1 Tax=Arachis ipaensis TaxID=130454 RepID=UPI000A2B8AB5|nr:uncharacterized protein LOC110263715 [Arachis ipaensis]